MTPRSIIQVRWPNEDEGGYFKVPGCLVAEGVALVIFDENIEVHLVELATKYTHADFFVPPVQRVQHLLADEVQEPFADRH